jgi:hypothetical protein
VGECELTVKLLDLLGINNLIASLNLYKLDYQRISCKHIIASIIPSYIDHILSKEYELNIFKTIHHRFSRSPGWFLYYLEEKRVSVEVKKITGALMLRDLSFNSYFTSSYVFSLLKPDHEE